MLVKNQISLVGIISSCLLIGGCNSMSTKTLNTSNTASSCGNKPTGFLDIKNVKNVQLSSQIITESGQVRTDKYLGYQFNAKSGDKLSYQTNDDVCIWVYAPNNEIITSKDLSTNGNYIIQVAAPQGVRNFELKLGLNVISSNLPREEPLVSNETSSQPEITIKPKIKETETVTETRKEPQIKPEEFVRDHYISLNNREYNKTWDHLSGRFKNEVGSYSQYEEWWNKVKEIRIGNIKTMKQSENTAIVNAELWYFMNDGKDFQDGKNNIYLIWSDTNKTWLFYRKY